MTPVACLDHGQTHLTNLATFCPVAMLISKYRNLANQKSQHDTRSLFEPWSDSPHPLGHILPSGHAHLKVQQPADQKSQHDTCHQFGPWSHSAHQHSATFCPSDHAHLKVKKPGQPEKSTWDVMHALPIWPVVTLISKCGNLSNKESQYEIWFWPSTYSAGTPLVWWYSTLWLSLSQSMATCPSTKVMSCDTSNSFGPWPCSAEGDGGLFLACENFGKMFDNLFPACPFFFFEWRLARAH